MYGHRVGCGRANRVSKFVKIRWACNRRAAVPTFIESVGCKRPFGSFFELPRRIIFLNFLFVFLTRDKTLTVKAVLMLSTRCDDSFIISHQKLFSYFRSPAKWNLFYWNGEQKMSHIVHVCKNYFYSFLLSVDLRLLVHGSKFFQVIFGDRIFFEFYILRSYLICSSLVARLGVF